jgi:hypothetical protein
MFGLMQQEGVFAGMLTAAQEGLQGDVGQTRVRLGLPIQKFKEKAELSKDEQQALRNVERLLGSEFLSSLRANKGLLGSNPSNNDAILLQKPMASIEDNAKAIQFWARNSLLLNKQREAMYNGYQQHMQQAGPSSSPGSFFRPGSIYEKINNDYETHRQKLFRMFNP